MSRTTTIQARILKKSLVEYMDTFAFCFIVAAGRLPTFQEFWATVGNDHGYASDAYVVRCITMAQNWFGEPLPLRMHTDNRAEGEATRVRVKKTLLRDYNVRV